MAELVQLNVDAIVAGSTRRSCRNRSSPSSTPFCAGSEVLRKLQITVLETRALIGLCRRRVTLVTPSRRVRRSRDPDDDKFLEYAVAEAAGGLLPPTAISLAEQSIVVRMGADPEPYEPVCRFDREGVVVSSDASGPEATDLLEVERGVPRGLFQARVRLIGKLLDFRRQEPVRPPEVGRRAVDQRGVVLPAA
jgi:hypothetical protein